MANDKDIIPFPIKKDQEDFMSDEYVAQLIADVRFNRHPEDVFTFIDRTSFQGEADDNFPNYK